MFISIVFKLNNSILLNIRNSILFISTLLWLWIIFQIVIILLVEVISNLAVAIDAKCLVVEVLDIVGRVILILDEAEEDAILLIVHVHDLHFELPLTLRKRFILHPQVIPRRVVVTRSRYLAVFVWVTDFGITLDLPIEFVYILKFCHVVYVFLQRVESFQIEGIRVAFPAEVIIAVVIAPEPMNWVF